MRQESILVVEDDPGIGDSLHVFLSHNGYRVRVAKDGLSMDIALRQSRFDLVLLDIMLPGESGFDICSRLRSSHDLRIIMLTALGEPADAVAGLELGADDFVTKPFNSHELLARVRATLRRGPGCISSEAPHSEELTMKFSDFVFYPCRRMMRSPSGLRIPLTCSETDLLLVLCQNPRRVLSREALISLTRGKAFPINQRSIDLLISRLRRKLTGPNRLENPIRTSRTNGYSFDLNVTVL